MNAKHTTRKRGAPSDNAEQTKQTFVLRLPKTMVAALDERAKVNFRTRNAEAQSILTTVLNVPGARA